MKSEQVFIKGTAVKGADVAKIKAIDPNMVFVFGGVSFFKDADSCKALKAEFPNAVVIGCSTAGEISAKGVTDNTLVVTGLQSPKAKTKATRQKIAAGADSKKCGMSIGEGLKAVDLSAVFVLGRGLDINGTALVDGIRSAVGKDVIVTGGLAGDGGAFQQTWTYLDGQSSDGEVVAVGLYGNGLKVGYGSVGGWKPFGPARKVTKSENNVMFTIDGEPALEVYKKYLGEDAKGLPGSGLRYPFALLNDQEDETGIIRTILAVDEKAGSLTFAGDIPQGGLVRLMHADQDGLVGGARKAAASSKSNSNAGVGILVSCVGRKLVLGDDIDNEVDAVREVLGDGNHVTGFYSYGEICPIAGFTECKLHNQTMTVTWFTEAS